MTRVRRAGGRAARLALRAAPLEEDVRPIKAGLEGGCFRPLTDQDMERIHRSALDALEVIGLADAPPSGIEIMTRAGAELGSDGRIRISRSLIEDTLDKAAREITLCGRDPRHDLELRGNKVHFGTAGAAVHMVDSETGMYRDPNVNDLFDCARIVEHLDNLHFFQRSVVCREFNDNRELDLNTIFAACSGTRKHVGVSFTGPETVPDAIELLHMIAGGEAAWRERPFVSNSNCFVVPPMKFAEESCKALELAIQAGMPVLLLSAGQAGATAPAPIAAAIVQAMAECLAGLFYVNAIVPGHPAVFGTWPFVSDLRTGAMSGGSAEQALLTSGCAQMHSYYGLSGGAAAGISDAKLPDMQAGWEQGITNTLAGLSGLNMVYEAAGMHASLLGFCLDSLVLGDDIIGQALRCIRGIDVTDETVSIDVMKEVCLEGPGHYLGSAQTLRLMQREYVYPRLGNRMSPKEWEEAEKPDLLASARKRKEEILQIAGSTISPDIDRAIRERFPIQLRPVELEA